MAESVVLAIKDLAERKRKKERQRIIVARARSFSRIITVDVSTSGRNDLLGDDYSNGGAPDRFGPPGIHHLVHAQRRRKLRGG